MPCGGFGWWWIRLSSSLCHPLPLWLGCSLCSLCSLHNLQEMWCFALFLGGNAIEEQQHPTAIADWFKKMSKKMKAIVISCDTKLLDCKFPSARAVFHNSAHVCSCASYSTNVYCHWICASGLQAEPLMSNWARSRNELLSPFLDATCAFHW